jgi:hypothetical protein
MTPSLPDDILGCVFAFCDADTRIQLGDIRRLNKKDARYTMLKQCLAAPFVVEGAQLLTYIDNTVDAIRRSPSAPERILFTTMCSRFITCMSIFIFQHGYKHERFIITTGGKIAEGRRLYPESLAFRIIDDNWNCLCTAWKKTRT